MLIYMPQNHSQQHDFIVYFKILEKSNIMLFSFFVQIVLYLSIRSLSYPCFLMPVSTEIFRYLLMCLCTSVCAYVYMCALCEMTVYRSPCVPGVWCWCTCVQVCLVCVAAAHVYMCAWSVMPLYMCAYCLMPLYMCGGWVMHVYMSAWCVMLLHMCTCVPGVCAWCMPLYMWARCELPLYMCSRVPAARSCCTCVHLCLVWAAGAHGYMCAIYVRTVSMCLCVPGVWCNCT